MQTSDMLELMRQMQISGIKVLEYEADNQRLRLEKAEANQLQDSVLPQSPAATSNLADPAPGDHIIKSPVVGVFYAAPAPGSEPFVQPGSKILPGDTVCIIEAMKLMNEVSSSIKGEIKQIFVQDGQRVEYGQPLISIKGDDNDIEAG